MRRRRLVLSAAALLAARPAAAESAPFILTVDGRLPGGPRDFTLAALEALGMRSLRTITPWTREVQHFSGVPLLWLLDALGVTATSLRAEALNRYSTPRAREDATERHALLATRLDGQPLRVRERGPVWLVFPWSQRPDLDRPEVHERAVWQLRRLSLG
ncbi:molybdopterin-dependent oxidoreductase [Roseomonas sp. ACRSG]|nr:molybdopterin-dependent oxidoreductase [Roseomonas sp. ACRSG]